MKAYYIVMVLCIMETQAISTLKQSPAPDIDIYNMFNAIYTFPEQIEQALHIGKRISLQHTYDHIEQICIVGMGGSGMAAHIMQSLLKETCTKNIVIHKNYTLPAWVQRNTLVICISYSGNTEETLSCFEQAHNRNVSIIGICAGGSLYEQLLTYDYDYIIVPHGLQPRAALGYLTVPLLYLIHKLGYIDDTIIKQLHNVPTHLKSYRDIFAAQDAKNPAYLYATNLKQCLPVIFGESNTTACIAQRWQAQFAENSKMISRTHMLPELNHNEIVGWKNNPHLLKSSAVIWLTDPDMHDRNKERCVITKNLLEGHPIIQLHFEGFGSDWCQRLFYLIHFGDWISYWCALAHSTDPTAITSIDMLKQTMRSVQI